MTQLRNSSAQAPRRIAAPPLEDLACTAIFTFFAIQGAIPGIAPPESHEMTGAAFTTLSTMGGIASQLLVNALIVFLLLRRPRLLLRNFEAVPWALALALLAIASTAWSLDPWLTLRRSIPFALATLFGLYFSIRFPPSRQLAILRLSFLALALATVAVVIFAPAIALDHTAGHAADWQGVFTQKNACGRIMVLATAVLLFSPRLTAARLLSLALFLFILFESGSRAAWAIEAAILILWLAFRLGRRVQPRIRLVLTTAAPIVLAAAAGAVVFLRPRLMLLLGRDPSLSGRTAIWTQSLRYIAKRPWLGYGYDAFWRGSTGPSLQISAAVHFIVEHAHNGFLEILLELGIAGLLLFALSWVLAARNFRLLWRAGSIDAIAFPAAILILIVLYDLDENTLLIYNGLFWPLYVATLATLHNLRFAARARSRAAAAPNASPATFQIFQEAS